jgi:Protein of unknown function (DUF3455)
MYQDTTEYTKLLFGDFDLRLLTTPGASALRFRNGALPAEIQVDESAVSLLKKLIGVGVQVYDYDGVNDKWVFREPQANLYDVETGVQRGIHFVGPYWADSAGSRVKGQVTGRADAPIKDKDVPWLKLDVVERLGSANLILQRATFIQRVLTYGGQAPSATGRSDGDTVGVPYTALYAFWG